MTQAIQQTKKRKEGSDNNYNKNTIPNNNIKAKEMITNENQSKKSNIYPLPYKHK